MRKADIKRVADIVRQLLQMQFDLSAKAASEIRGDSNRLFVQL